MQVPSGNGELDGGFVDVTLLLNVDLETSHEAVDVLHSETLVLHAQLAGQLRDVLEDGKIVQHVVQLSLVRVVRTDLRQICKKGSKKSYWVRVNTNVCYGG